eukprot:scaffold55158_cov38-Attheya_sp.AAC.1
MKSARLKTVTSPHPERNVTERESTERGSEWSPSATYAGFLVHDCILNEKRLQVDPILARIDQLFTVTVTVTIILGAGAIALPLALEGPFLPFLPKPMRTSTREQKKSRENRHQKREAGQLDTSVGGATTDHGGHGRVLVLVKNVGGRSVHVHVDCSLLEEFLLDYADWKKEMAATDATWSRKNTPPA